MTGQKESTPRSSGMGELDELVLQEFNAMERLSGPARKSGDDAAQKSRTGKDAERIDNIIFSPRWRTAAQGPAAEGEVPDAESEAPVEMDETGMDLQFDDAALEDERSGESLLTAEEEAFVAEAVSWLGARPNPDIVLDRIWRALLTSEDKREAEETGQTPGPSGPGPSGPGPSAVDTGSSDEA